MLGKLLKFEMKSTARIFLPMYLILLAFALMSRFSIAGMNTDISFLQNNLINVLLGVVVAGYVLLLLSTLIITFIVVIQRFYKNLTGDEGYLMHTLPVSTHQLLITKVISGSIWELATTLMIFVSLFVLLFQPMALYELGYLWEELMDGLRTMFSYVDAGQLVLFGVQVFISMVIGVVYSTLMIYAAIAIGHTFKQHRVLGAALAYIGLMTITQMVAGFVSVVVTLPYVNSMDMQISQMMQYLNVLMAVSLLISVVFMVAYYFINHYVLSSHLNLE